MKKNCLSVLLCYLFLLTATCSAPSPASLREAENSAVLLPPDSSNSDSSAELPAPRPDEDSGSFIICAELDPGCEDEEMRDFLEKVINQEPASITWSESPTRTEIIYDCVTFTVTEYYEEYTDKWYYSNLEATSTSAWTMRYQLTDIGTFTEEPRNKPPETFFLAELPADTAPLPTAKPSVAPSEPPEDYPLETAIENGDYVNRHGEILNQEMMDDFLVHVTALEPAQIRIVQYTTEGDPILTDVSYDGTIFTVTEDSTRDAFGPGTVGTNYYTALEQVYIPETDITEYRLTAPATGMGQAFPLDYMVLKYDLGNTTAP